MEELYQEIYQLMKDETGQEGRDFAIGAFSGLGWLYAPYKSASFDGLYPKICLKEQKNAVHVYVTLFVDGKSVIENYTAIFGKSAIGKSCIRVKKLTRQRREALEEIINLVVESVKTS